MTPHSYAMKKRDAFKKKSSLSGVVSVTIKWNPAVSRSFRS